MKTSEIIKLLEPEGKGREHIVSCSPGFEEWAEMFVEQIHARLNTLQEIHDKDLSLHLFNSHNTDAKTFAITGKKGVKESSDCIILKTDQDPFIELSKILARRQNTLT